MLAVLICQLVVLDLEKSKKSLTILFLYILKSVGSCVSYRNANIKYVAIILPRLAPKAVKLLYISYLEFNIIWKHNVLTPKALTNGQIPGGGALSLEKYGCARGALRNLTQPEC